MSLDSPERESEIRKIIAEKPALKSWYQEQYGKYEALLRRTPSGAPALELGSGAGFAKSLIPNLITSDVIPYPGIDQVIDASRLPFADHGLGAVFLLNVLHHLPDAEGFFRELERALMPGGRCLIIDQNRGYISKPILKYVHHEPFNETATEWAIPGRGPLSDANGALAWMIFTRDRARFERIFPRLRIVSMTTHSPLRYWLAGGLKRWSLLPAQLFPTASLLDRALVRLTPQLGSFIDIELERVSE